MGHHRLLPPHSDHPFPPKVDEVENTIARRAYELFASRGFIDGHHLDDWFLAQSELFGKMPVSVTETENEVTVRAGLPGFTGKDIEIRVEPRRLFIGGMHEEKSENKKKGETIYSEHAHQVFRTVNLPADVDVDKGKATLSNGDLEITLAKREIGKRIPVEQKAA